MHFMNEEGDMLDGHHGNPEDQINNDPTHEDLGVVEDGFEDAGADVSGFATDQFHSAR